MIKFRYENGDSRINADEKDVARISIENLREVISTSENLGFGKMAELTFF